MSRKILKRDAECLVHFLQKTIYGKIKLIGSFGKNKKSSKHDIDILLSGKKKTVRLRNHIKNLLDAKKVEDTDWGGWYFHDTFYGDVDIFFTTKNFDK